MLHKVLNEVWVPQKEERRLYFEYLSFKINDNLSFPLACLVPPHVPSCEVPSSVFVGSGLELHCKDKLSVPPATYRWYKDNKALTGAGDTPFSVDTNKGTLVSQIVKYKTSKPKCEKQTRGSCSPRFMSLCVCLSGAEV